MALALDTATKNEVAYMLCGTAYASAPTDVQTNITNCGTNSLAVMEMESQWFNMLSVTGNAPDAWHSYFVADIVARVSKNTHPDRYQQYAQDRDVGGVLASFAAIVQKYPQALLVLKGLDATYRSSHWLSVEWSGFDDAYARWKASKNTTYIGDVLGSEALASIMQNADCYVSPYKSEAFNLPVLEASACGTTVIVTEGGCTDDFVTDDFSIKVPAKLADHEGDGCQYLKTDNNDIYAAMERAILDHELRARSLRAGPENAKKYTWKSVTDRLVSVITGVLKGNK